MRVCEMPEIKAKRAAYEDLIREVKYAQSTLMDDKDVVVMHISEQVEPASDIGNAVISFPLIGGLLAKMFG
jgi:hypothetical protein